MRKLSTQETYGVVCTETKTRIGVPYDKQLGLHILPRARYHFTATGRIGYQLEYFDITTEIGAIQTIRKLNGNRFGESIKFNDKP